VVLEIFIHTTNDDGKLFFVRNISALISHDAETGTLLYVSAYFPEDMQRHYLQALILDNGGCVLVGFLFIHAVISGKSKALRCKSWVKLLEASPS
jgi:hypothetical protein